MDIQNHDPPSEMDAPAVDPLNVDVDPSSKDKKSSIARGVEKHFTDEDLQAAENWETRHRDQVPPNFDQVWNPGNYDPFLGRVENVSSQRRKRLTLLQTLLGDGQREDCLRAYIEWEKAGRSEECLGRLAKKYGLSDIRHSLDCVETFLAVAGEGYPDFDPLSFLSEAREYFAQLLKDATWAFIQRDDAPDDIETKEDWTGLQGPLGRPRRKKLIKPDSSGYGSLTAQTVMTQQEVKLPSGPPTGRERSAFGPSPRLPNKNSAVVPAVIFRTPKQEECRVLENGLTKYLAQFAPGEWGGREQIDFVDIVNLKEQGWKLAEIAKHIGRSERTVQNRIDDLKEWAGNIN